MFTGIIEAKGVVKKIVRSGTNLDILVASPVSHELRVDQSLSHNGVCLTVTRLDGGGHWVTVIRETLDKSSLGRLVEGSPVNLERSMKADGRFDGHIVQGHVDQTGIVNDIRDVNGSWLVDIEFDPKSDHVTVEKGSICIDGVSLTCFNSRPNGFTVAIIPYTYDNTTFGRLKRGDIVNLEFDIIGKYVRRLAQ